MKEKKKIKMNWWGGYDNIDEDIKKYLKAGFTAYSIAESLKWEYEGFQKPGVALRRVMKTME